MECFAFPFLFTTLVSSDNFLYIATSEPCPQFNRAIELILSVLDDTGLLIPSKAVCGIRTRTDDAL